MAVNAENRELQKWQSKLSTIYGHINSLYESSKTIKMDDPTSIDNFLADCFTIDSSRREFQEALEQRNDFLVSNPELSVPNYGSWLSFEQLYTKIKYKINQLNAHIQNQNREIPHPEIKKEKSNYRLPKLDLCTFNGDNESWPIFYETFRTVIHENSELTDGEKVQYLVGKLTGKASTICQGILPTAENYHIIWNALINKYNDKRVLASTYLDRLLNLPAVDQSSPQSLETYIDTFSSIIAALKQLKLPSLEDFLFIYIGCKKIGLETVKSFEMEYKGDTLPTCSQFTEFVRNHAHILQRANVSSCNNNKSNAPLRKQAPSQAHPSGSNSIATAGRGNKNYGVKTFVNIQGSTKCASCGTNDHTLLAQCPKFLALSEPERFKIVKANKMCVNCLSENHTIRDCSAQNRCSICNRSHHSLLHFNSTNNNNLITNKSAVTNLVTDSLLNNDASNTGHSESDPAVLCAIGECVAAASKCNYDNGKNATSVLIGTAKCHVVDAQGNITVLRVLVDNASQRDLITTECCNILNLPVYPSEINNVSGIGDVSSTVEGVTCLTIRSRYDDSVRFTIQPLIVNKIPTLPTSNIDVSRLDYINKVPLADDSYYTPGKIDLILGADLFARIIGPKSIERSKNEPVALDTLLGYIIVGKAPVVVPGREVVRTYCTMTETANRDLNRFFEIEDVPNISNSLSPEDQLCEKMYCDTIQRDDKGRYIVSLPFKNDPSVLGDSMRSAERRYIAQERRLLCDSNFKLAYDKVIQEYLDKDYLRPAELSSESELQYVIPHHGVVRDDKDTTKLRIVLNGSNPTTSGLSLNDALYTGPNLQNNLFEILLKFRLFPIAVTADIRQMYLRILMKETDIRFQRILYRFNPDEPIKLYEVTRVPFGLCCSPYLAMRTVRQLASDERDRFPKAASVAEDDMYMDDLATSCLTAADGIELSSQLIGMFATADFQLVKFASNSPEVMESIPAAHRVTEEVEFSPENYLKILGLKWLPSEDVFTFKVSPQPRECTKRNILSVIARIWDVMGFVAPVTLLAKLLIKSLWNDKIGWDEVPTQNVVSQWLQFEAELPLLQNVKLPRHIGVFSDCIVTILGCADASEKAYGGVVYLHVHFPNANRTLVNLVCAKSRVAPTKTVITLARMELCGNDILARIMRPVVDTYSARCPVHNIYAFSDSTIALGWIRANPTRWDTFVANRVSRTQQLVDPSKFFHISGKDNPADCLSRGLTPSQLVDHPLWFSGPSFAHLPTTEWPLHGNEDFISEDDLPEQKVHVLTTIPTTDTSRVFYDLASRVSSWPKLLRIVIYVLRFIKKLPRKFEVSHLEIAELEVIKNLQRVYFQDEINKINSGQQLSPAFMKLNAFLKDGVLRVGGRLANADLEYNSKHPLLLPRRDHIVNMIIDYYHRKHLHCGPQLLMSLIRQKFWILSARSIVRNRVQKCNTCFRTYPRNEAPIMADLPEFRVQEAKAFCHTGVDYAGPLPIIPYRRRGVHSIKAYLCLFVCLITKAVHLELATDLSTECFLNALKRFISRRGPVSVMHSDRGTNFIGAKSAIDNVYSLIESQKYQDKFANELRENRIEFRFNPASSPHFGGMWEANVRSVKTHLSKVVGNQLLTYEEMTTVLAQIEAVLNSRPLSVLSCDPSEPLALTPSHFLVMTPLKYLPAEDLSNENVRSLMQRKRLVDHLVQCFWRRWKLEYLNTLQLRNKWTKASDSIKVGTVVILKSDNSAPLDWPIGIIERTFPGRDGVVRVVNVRTKTGVYRRPVVKVFPLPNQ